MNDSSQTESKAKETLSNGIPPSNFTLPLPDSPDNITANLLLQIEQTPNPRLRFIYQTLVKHLHALVKETNLSTNEWMAAIEFLTRVGQIQRMRQLSGVLGVGALIRALNDPVTEGATESTILGPFYTEDTEDIELGGSIASEGQGEYMYVEGRVLTRKGEPIPDAVIDTWEADPTGLYDIQYENKTHPDYRGRLRSAKDGSFGYRAIVPCPYPVPCEGPIRELLISQGRHNMRPGHLHLIVQAPGYRKLVTALYPEGCVYLMSDVSFAVKKSLIVKLEQVDDDLEARKRGFPKGGSFKLLKYDIVLAEKQSE